MMNAMRCNKRYIKLFDMPGGGIQALAAAMVNRAIEDFNKCKTGSLNYCSARAFLKEWNIIK